MDEKMSGYIRISELAAMGASLRCVECIGRSVLCRKFAGILQWEEENFYVYVRYGFYSGGRIRGVIRDYYTDDARAQLCSAMLKERYQKKTMECRKTLREIRLRRMLWDGIAHAIAAGVAFFYVSRMQTVGLYGMDPASALLSIVYPLIVALCYVIHYKVQ